jgi:hypothetical protein
LFPGPLAGFREEDWPPVPGECLGHYSCNHGTGYTASCSPRPGEFCGQLHYEMVARDYPDRPELLARAKAADAYERYRQARLSWLGEDHPDYVEELLGGWGEEHAIRYG